MNAHYVQIIADKSIKTVGVIFEDYGKVYTYKTRLNLVEGQKVIVHVSGCNPEFKVVEVAEVHKVPRIKPSDTKNYKWILQIVEEMKYIEAEIEDTRISDRVDEKIQEMHHRRAEAELKELLGHVSSFYIEATAEVSDDENMV